MSFSERRLVTPFARRFTKFVMVGFIDSLSLRKARPFTTWEAIAGKDALRFVALRPGLLRISFLMLKENPNLEAGQSYRCSED
jgi:hypothetical protein